ncbi:MAG: Gfo/Idh/MocA family oxidoreductase [Candidatus Paceibacterota bacterium]
MTKNDIKIILVGFGSIGSRHYRNLKSLGFEDVSVYDVVMEHVPADIKTVSILDSKTLKNFDVAFICNPTSDHLKTAALCAKAGCHLFIEKPLSNKLVGIAELQKICQKNKLINMVGCNMRFHPCLDFVKKYIADGKLGKVWNIKVEYGQYLPYWRPSQDYRKNYSAKKNMGGGVALDEIHEFDLLFWLNNFKKVLDYKLIKNKSSDLEIETEDQATGVFLFENGLIGTVSCDYLSKRYRRNLAVIGEEGNLVWDWNVGKVFLENKENSSSIFSLENYDINDMYMKEMEYFFDCVACKKETFNDIKKSESVLKFLLKK